MLINNQVFIYKKPNNIFNINKIKTFFQGLIKTNTSDSSLKMNNYNDLKLLHNAIKKVYICQNEKELFQELTNFIKFNFPCTSGALYVFDESSKNWYAESEWNISKEKNEHLLKVQIPLGIKKEVFASLILFTKVKNNLSIIYEFIEHFLIAIKNIKEKNIIKREAVCDHLTGLYNRRFMEETLNREVSRSKRNKNNIGIIILDIDFFKKINDTYGHDVGDHVLKETSKILKNNVRKSDIVCRMGGEEFILILPEITKENCLKRANKILEEIQKTTIAYKEFEINITASFGVSIYKHNDSNIFETIDMADSALYESKRKGRNTVICK